MVWPESAVAGVLRDVRQRRNKIDHLAWVGALRALVEAHESGIRTRRPSYYGLIGRERGAADCR